MTREYQKPELIDLKNSKAAGACSGGSAPALGEQCSIGTSPLGCISGAIATPLAGCATGSVAAPICTTGSSVQA